MENKAAFASKEWAMNKIKKGIIQIVVITIGLIIIAGCSEGEYTEKLIQYQGNSVGISTFTDILEVTPIQITLYDLKINKNIELNIDMSNAHISSYLVNGSHCNLIYRNINDDKLSDIQTEISIYNTADSIEDIVEKLKENGKYTKLESSEDLEGLEEIYTNTTDKYFRAVKKLTPSTAIEVNQLKLNTTEEDFFAVDMIKTIQECILYSEYTENEYGYLDIDGLGVYQLDNIFSIEYNETVGSLEIISDGTTYTITNSGSTNIDNKPGEKIDNTYTIYDLTSSNINGLGIDTGRGKYIIKVSNNKTVREIKEMLGVDNNG